PPRAALRSVLLAVRQGAPGVPGGLLFLGAGVLSGDGGVFRLSADRLLARAGGAGLEVRRDGLPLRLLARAARALQRPLLEPLPLRRPLPDRGKVRPGAAASGVLDLPGALRGLPPRVFPGDDH